jgi:hypothetical protein
VFNVNSDTQSQQSRSLAIRRSFHSQTTTLLETAVPVGLDGGSSGRLWRKIWVSTRLALGFGPVHHHHHDGGSLLFQRCLYSHKSTLVHHHRNDHFGFLFVYGSNHRRSSDIGRADHHNVIVGIEFDAMVANGLSRRCCATRLGVQWSPTNGGDESGQSSLAYRRATRIHVARPVRTIVQGELVVVGVASCGWIASANLCRLTFMMFSLLSTVESGRSRTGILVGLVLLFAVRAH